MKYEPQGASGIESGPDLRSYGRRRGRTLSSRQAGLVANALPRVGLNLTMPPPAPLASLFDARVFDVWLEIGFGGGEHLLWQAEQNTGVGLIGAEPFLDGVVKALAAIEARGSQNVRLYADDARPLLRWLPEGSIGRVFLLFPDPWPKRRHAKRRLVAPATLALLSRVMRGGAELRTATDDPDYASEMLLKLKSQGTFEWLATGPEDWRKRRADWRQTRYEAKALQAGRRSYYFVFQRV